jgi:hypothetical protein
MGMTVRKLLRDGDRSFRITLPKDELKAAGIVEIPQMRVITADDCLLDHRRGDSVSLGPQFGF